MVAARWALLSAYDKGELGELCRKLLQWDYRLLATRGTAQYLAGKGIETDPVAGLTGWEELLGGRVKTLHPKILAGILARRDVPEDLEDLETAGAVPIDLVVVNLYPFAPDRAKAGADDPLALIDVGGVALLRAAAKNWPAVAPVTSPAQYGGVVEELQDQKGTLTEATRHRLAMEAFAVTSDYDARIYNALAESHEGRELPPELRLAYGGSSPLRYGENPYQRAAFYRDPGFPGASVAGAEDLFHRGLSFNNILDLDAALELAMKFDRPTAAIIKHTSAAGVASADALPEAYRLARACDPKSAYGCVVGFNRPVTAATAEALRKHFVEAIIAPEYEEEAREILRGKKKLRALRTGRPIVWEPAIHVLGVRGGVLVQTREWVELGPADLKAVTRKTPTAEQIQAMLFAYRVLGHVKSNAIVLAKGEQTVGIGSGQMSRVDSVIVAGEKAGKAAQGSVLASDAFFPFRDGIDEAAKAGVAAIAQPGGSIRDAEVIEAADEHGLCMVFTGIRVFKH